MNPQELSDHDLLIGIDARLSQLCTYIYGTEGNGGLSARVRTIERWLWLITGALLALLGRAAYLSGWIKP